ncbi:unnamed protein product [Notodromas monacha]|uniref:Ubiquitin-like domain-containing protein n=1 Tax=Notodromas monacha TaxID=399045 RepID=A0A7R9BEW9_9CRUS|nr:unnamed protein product [Notodromas monacha]CAG0913558.1 unnamed protein product [Notodromas monacha]
MKTDHDRGGVNASDSGGVPLEPVYFSMPDILLIEEMEALAARLREKEKELQEMEANILSEAVKWPQGERAHLTFQLQAADDRYNRLLEAHRRLAKVNQNLEDKLLKVVDACESEKNALVTALSQTTQKLAQAHVSLKNTKEELERYKADCSLAVHLLQCRSSNFLAQRIETLPSQFQEKVNKMIERRTSNLHRNSKNSQTGSKVIKVPIPTYPPTAMVFTVSEPGKSLSRSSSRDSNSEYVSAAVLGKVMEENAKEREEKWQKRRNDLKFHCESCVCIRAANSSSNRRDDHTDFREYNDREEPDSQSNEDYSETCRDGDSVFVDLECEDGDGRKDNWLFTNGSDLDQAALDSDDGSCGLISVHRSQPITLSSDASLAMIDVTVKTLDSENYKFSVPDTLSVIDFKRRISSSVGVEPSRQRLIFCGRVLDDEKSLGDYDVSGKVIHLVQRPPPEEVGRQPSSAPTPQASPSQPENPRRTYRRHNAFPLPSSVGFSSPGMSAALRIHVAQEMLARMNRCVTGVSSRETGGANGEEQAASSESASVAMSLDESSDRDPSPPIEINITSGPMVDQAVAVISLEAGVDADGDPASEVLLGDDPSEMLVGEEQGVPHIDAPLLPPPTGEGAQADTGDSADRPSIGSRRVTGTLPPSELADLLETVVGNFEEIAPLMHQVVDDIRSGRWAATNREDDSSGTRRLSEPHARYQKLSRALHFFSHALHNISDIKSSDRSTAYLTAIPRWIARPPAATALTIPMRGTATIMEGPAVVSMHITPSVAHGPTSTNAPSGPARAGAVPTASVRPRSAGAAPGVAEGAAGSSPVNMHADLGALFGQVASAVMGATVNITGMRFVPGGGLRTAPTGPSPTNSSGSQTPPAGGIVIGDLESMNPGELGSLFARFAQRFAQVMAQGAAVHLDAGRPASTAGNEPGSTAGEAAAASGIGGFAGSLPMGTDEMRRPFMQSMLSAMRSINRRSADSAAQTTTGSERPTQGGSGGQRQNGSGRHSRLAVPLQSGHMGPRNLMHEFDPFLVCDSRHTLAGARRSRLGAAMSGMPTMFLHAGTPEYMTYLGGRAPDRAAPRTSGTSRGAQTTASDVASSSTADVGLGSARAAPRAPPSGVTTTIPPVANWLRMIQDQIMGSEANPSNATLDWLYNSPIFDSMRLSQDLAISDVLAIWSGEDMSAISPQLRQRLRDAVGHYVLHGNPPTPLNISNGVEDFVVSRFHIAGANDLEGSVFHINVVESLRHFLRTNIREVITKLYEPGDDAQFFNWLKVRVPDAVCELMMLCSLCFSNGVEGLEWLMRTQWDNFCQHFLGDVPSPALLGSHFIGVIMRESLPWFRARIAAVPPGWEAEFRRKYIVARVPNVETNGVSVDLDVNMEDPDENLRRSVGGPQNASSVPAPDRRTASNAAPNAVDAWEEVLPRQWIEVVRDDIRLQATHPPQRRPFSDAYLSGMGSKRRRMTEKQKAPCEPGALLQGALRGAMVNSGMDPISADRLADDAQGDMGLTAAFGSHLRRELNRRVDTEPDAKRYPNLNKYLARDGNR